jgi:hypothetical protein
VRWIEYESSSVELNGIFQFRQGGLLLKLVTKASGKVVDEG